MSSTTLFEMPFSEFQLKNAVSSALQQSLNNPTKFSIESNLEMAVRNCMQENLGNITINNGHFETPPPPDNFRMAASVVLIIGINYNFQIDAKITADLSTLYNIGNFATNTSLHLSLYNTELVLADRKKKINKKFAYDATLTIGALFVSGKGVSTRLYSINQDTFSSVLNDYYSTFGFAEAFTFNSAVNEKFGLEKIQRQGILNIRYGNFYMSSNNDSKYYLGGNTDFAHTGGIIIGYHIADFGIIEVDHHAFTGLYDEQNDFQITKEIEEIDNNIRIIKNDKNISRDERKKLTDTLRKQQRTKLKNNPYHSQSEMQKNFNKAFNSLNFIKDNKQIRLEVETSPFVQKGIHYLIKNQNFDPYEIQKQPTPFKMYIQRNSTIDIYRK